MKIVILLGAPGAGKGTAAEGIVQATRLLHVSTGDMLREAVKARTPVGLEAESYMNRGELVPDAVVIRVIESRLERGRQQDAYLFDGFPRTLEQARLLRECAARRGGSVTKVVFLDAPRDVLVSRLAGRRLCKQCGANYHVVNIPPARAGVCDRCGGSLYQRADDAEETVRNRLDVYAAQTSALIAYYEGEGLLARVDSSRDRNVVVAEIVAMLKAANAT